MTKSFFIFFGPPGSGKGTQAYLLAKKLKLPLIAPGELLRREMEQATAIGEKIKTIITSGKLVDDKTVEKIINQRFTKDDIKQGAIFDGFPRRLSQQRYLVKMLDGLSGAQDKIYAILVDVSDSVVKQRFVGRRICACGAVYHLTYKPPKQKGRCDNCGRKLFIRSDDRPLIVAKRLKLYHKQSQPMLDYWQKLGKLIRLDGERTIARVHQDIWRKVERIR